MKKWISLVGWLLSIGISIGVTYYFSDEGGFNRGVNHANKTFTTEIIEGIERKHIMEKAEEICLERIDRLRNELNIRNNELNICNKDLAKYKADIEQCEYRANKKPIVEGYFNSVFDRLELAANRANELGKQKSPGDQAIKGLNEEAKSILSSMAVGKKRFFELSIALNDEAEKLLIELEKGRMPVWDLRDRLVPLANSREEKEALARDAMNDLINELETEQLR